MTPDLMDDGYSARKLLADRSARSAVRALRGAVFVSLLRAIAMPLLIQNCPPNTFPGIDPTDVQIWGYSQATLFAILSVWAGRDPLSATLSAIVFYVAMAIPDLANQTGFLQQGWISKCVMLSILGRALVAGLIHRSYLAKPSVEVQPV